MAFAVTRHYPAHNPPIDELNYMASEGWFIQSAIIGSPESAHAVPPLVIIWIRWPTGAADVFPRDKDAGFPVSILILVALAAVLVVGLFARSKGFL